MKGSAPNILEAASAADIHDNNIRTDFFNIFIWNNVFRFTPKQGAKLIASRDDDFAYLAGTFVKFQIADFAKALTIL